MVALGACPAPWRRGMIERRSGKATGLRKVARQSAVRAQHNLYCSHTEERFSDIRRPHGDLVNSLGRHGRRVVAVLCDGGSIETS